jgi:hypothetical protein
MLDAVATAPALADATLVPVEATLVAVTTGGFNVARGGFVLAVEDNR